MIFKDLKNDQRFIRIGISIVLFFILLTAFFLDPVLYKISDCSFLNLTGYSCPSCGLSRSFHAGANFRIAESFAFHIMGPLLLLACIFLFLKYLIEGFSGKAMLLSVKSSIFKVAFLGTGIVWAIYWVFRMASEIVH